MHEARVRASQPLCSCAAHSQHARSPPRLTLLTSPAMADDMLVYIAGTGDVEEAMRLIEEDGAAVNARNANEATPLHVAAGRADIGMIEMLVRHGADVDAQEAMELGSSGPLHYAVRGGDVDVVEALLNAGANPSMPEGLHGFTPLHVAARMSLNDIAKLLVSKGADVNRRDLEGFNASYWAKESDNADFLKIAGMPAPAAALAEEMYEALRTKMEISEAVAAGGAPKKKAKGKKGKKGKKKK